MDNFNALKTQGIKRNPSLTWSQNKYKRSVRIFSNPKLTFFIRHNLSSSGGVVVKLLTYGARGQRFDSWSQHCDFRNLLSPSSSMAEISFK